MIGWLKPLLSILSAIAGFFRDKQLLDAGRARERSEAQEEVLEDVAEKNRLVGELGDADARKQLRDKHYHD